MWLKYRPHVCFFPTLSKDRARPIPLAQPEACPQRSERPVCTRSPHRSRSGYPGWYNYLRSWWRHQMETFSALLVLCAGNSSVTCEFPSLRPVMRSFDVFFDLRLDKRLSNNRDAGDLKRHRGHYDVIVMIFTFNSHIPVISIPCSYFSEWIAHQLRVISNSPLH